MFCSPRQLTFTWNAQNPDDVDAYLMNISGSDDQCGSRDILHRTTENSYTCSGWSPAGQNYTLSVQAVNCGGEGPASDPVTVWLKSKQKSGATVYVCPRHFVFEDIYSHYSTATLPNPTILVHYITGVPHLRIMNLG